MLRKHPRSVPRICTFDFNGFAVVMAFAVVLLMAIAMTANGFAPTPGMSIDLARAHHAVPRVRADQENAIVIAITRDGRIYLKSNPADIANLPTMIHECLRQGAERKAYFKVDQNAKYKDVVDAIDKVRSAGVNSLCFLVVERDAAADQ